MDVIIIMDRVERNPDVAACDHQRRRPAYTSAQCYDLEGEPGGNRVLVRGRNVFKRLQLQI